MSGTSRTASIESVGEDLDPLYQQHEESWGEIVRKIKKLLEG